MNLRLHRDRHELSEIDSDYDPLNDKTLSEELFDAVSNGKLDKVKILVEQGQITREL